MQVCTFHIHTFHFNTYFTQIIYKHNISVQHNTINTRVHNTLPAHSFYTQPGFLLIYYPPLLLAALLHFMTSEGH